jgi:hypothetical protein
MGLLYFHIVKQNNHPGWRKGTSIYKFTISSQWNSLIFSGNLGTFVSCEESNNNILSILFPVRINKSKRAAVDFPSQCPLLSLVKVGLRLHRQLRSEDGKRKRLFEYQHRKAVHHLDWILNCVFRGLYYEEILGGLSLSGNFDVVARMHGAEFEFNRAICLRT